MDKIHIEGLEKTCASIGGRVTALPHVDLTIRQNEFITLAGPFTERIAVPWAPKN